MKHISIKQLFEQDIKTLWSNYSGSSEYLIQRGFAVQDKQTKGAILFIGINPSFNPNEPYLEFFYNNDNRETIHPYFKKFVEISDKTSMPWSHIDLLYFRETSQKIAEEIYEKDKSFILDQLHLTKQMIIATEPKVIVISNAFARNLFSEHIFKTKFDTELGTHKIIESAELLHTPVFYTSMLTGQRALDLGSYDRLVWHIKRTLKLYTLDDDFNQIHELDMQLQERLPHLKLHPNYLPYIGKNYTTAKQKILIIAESHYLDEKFDGQITAELWHNEPERVYELLNSSSKGEDEWFKTRNVIATYLAQKRKRKIDKGLTIFTNMENAYHEVEPDVNLLDQCIFMNYFQRPAEYKGESIKNSYDDNILAKETVLTYIELFKPNKVLFVSSLAYSNFTYQLNLNPVEGLPYIGETPHPSSAWWNKHAAKYASKDQPNATGRDKFIRVLRMKNEANKH